MDRYQDYVIKNGEFIGKFEEMYQKFDDPWHQKEYQIKSYMKYAVDMSIKKYGLKSLLEVGCGLGWITDFLWKNNPNITIEGMDISETAIKKARLDYPYIKFYVGNLLDYSKKDLKLTYDTLLFAEIMWYILEDIDNIIENLNHNFYGKLIMINQTFYKGGIQKYGREFFSSLDEMCSYLPWDCLDMVIEEHADSDSIATHTVFRIS